MFIHIYFNELAPQSDCKQKVNNKHCLLNITTLGQVLDF